MYFYNVCVEKYFSLKCLTIVTNLDDLQLNDDYLKLFKSI